MTYKNWPKNKDGLIECINCHNFNPRVATETFPSGRKEYWVECSKCTYRDCKHDNMKDAILQWNGESNNLPPKMGKLMRIILRQPKEQGILIKLFKILFT